MSISLISYSLTYFCKLSLRDSIQCQRTLRETTQLVLMEDSFLWVMLSEVSTFRGH